jgi:hypothetical protein
MVGKKTKHYVNNKDFYQALVDYKKLCKRCIRTKQPLPQIPKYIGECIQMICKKLSAKWNFGRYTPLYLEEMVEDGILQCIAAVDNFKSEASNNPFAYFTTIAWNAFVRRIEQENAQNYTKHKNLENLFVLSDEFYSEMDNRVQNNQPINENDGLQRHYDVIRNFEAKISRKKEKTRQSGLQKHKIKPR